MESKIKESAGTADDTTRSANGRTPWTDQDVRDLLRNGPELQRLTSKYLPTIDIDNDQKLTAKELTTAYNNSSNPDEARLLSASMLATFKQMSLAQEYSLGEHFPKTDSLTGDDVAQFSRFLTAPREEMIKGIRSSYSVGDFDGYSRFIAKTHLGIPIGYGMGAVALELYGAGYGLFRSGLAGAAVYAGAMALAYGYYYWRDSRAVNRSVNTCYNAHLNEFNKNIDAATLPKS